jgi:hypothetical protein
MVQMPRDVVDTCCAIEFGADERNLDELVFTDWEMYDLLLVP